MDPQYSGSQASASEATPDQGPCYYLFAYYHPERSPLPEDLYASSIFDEFMAESAYHFSSTNFPISLDPSGGCTAFGIGSLEDDQYSTNHPVTIPPGKMSTYSELIPHIVAHETTVSLKQEAWVVAQPQPCVSPALCQGHADLPECAEFNDELDCPGELAADFDAESAHEETHSHPPPPPSPYSTPSPPPSLSSSCCQPPSTSRVVRPGRGKNQYSLTGVKATPSRKRKSVSKRGPGRNELRKPRKRREAVSLACYFCRKRKIACRQPPTDSLDRTCDHCKIRGVECKYPAESRRGARRGSATSCGKRTD